MNRLGVVGIVIEDKNKISEVNQIVGEYAEDIMGRMGLPQKDMSVIALIVDITNDRLGAFTGKLGRIEGVIVKSTFTK